jgi:hypothetical protein
VLVGVAVAVAVAVEVGVEVSVGVCVGVSVGVVVAVGVTVDVGVEVSVGVSVGVLVGVVVVVDVGVSVLVGVCVGVSVGVAVAVAVDVVKSGDGSASLTTGLAIPSEQSWIHWDSRRAASTGVDRRERNIVTSISFTMALFVFITASIENNDLLPVQFIHDSGRDQLQMGVVLDEIQVVRGYSQHGAESETVGPFLVQYVKPLQVIGRDVLLEIPASYGDAVLQR